VGRPAEYGPRIAAAARVVHEAAGGIGAKRLQPLWESWRHAWRNSAS
jgi:hypothetical protein